MQCTKSLESTMVASLQNTASVRIKLNGCNHSREEAEIALMKTLKVTLDPKGILNPGRIF